MTQPTTSTKSHDTLVHLQAWHAVMPPYLAEPEEVHAWVHDDAEEACDRDHAVSNLIAAGRS